MISTISLLVLMFLVLFGQRARSIQLPDPDAGHQFKVAVAHFPLTDTATKDAYDAKFDRSIMVSLFIPVPRDTCSNECQNRYMPGQTSRIANEQFILNATDGIFENIGYTVCCRNTADIDAANLNVVVVEPHTDTSRLLYLNMARFISANGVAVVLLDHPGDTSITEFTPANTPRGTVYNSGTVPLSNLSPLTAWNNTIVKAVNTRIADITLALSQLSSMELLQRQMPTLRFSTPLHTKSFSILGHGLGGTVATSLSFSDPNTRFSINLSGTPPLLNTSTAAPIYFFARTDFSRATDIHWPTTWAHLTGPATQFDLANATIFDFSDLPVVLELARSSSSSSSSPSRDLRARGLASSASMANHAMLCFAEAVVRKELFAQDTAIGNCIRLFNDMVPYAGGQGIVRHVARSGAGRLRLGFRLW